MPLRAPKGFIDETDPRVCLIGHPAPGWLVNYADLMTELVCFFVILYALSASLDKQAKDAAAEINQSETPGVTAEVTKRGLEIKFNEVENQALFESGSAELTPAMERVIASVTPKLKKLLEKRDLVVEGHTDDVPIHNDLYWNNWELSSARATNVVGFLVKAEGLVAKRLAATGFGEHRPIVPNDSPEHRRKNRRIVFLVPPTSELPKEAAPEEAKEAKAMKPGETGEEEEPATEVATVSEGGVSGILDSVLSKIRGK